MIWNMEPTKEYEALIEEASESFGCPKEFIRNPRCRKSQAGMIRGCIGSLLYNEMGCRDLYALKKIMGVHHSTAHSIINEHASRVDHWPIYRDSYNHLKGKFIKETIL
jgi:hypothetical protein